MSQLLKRLILIIYLCLIMCSVCLLCLIDVKRVHIISITLFFPPLYLLFAYQIEKALVSRILLKNYFSFLSRLLQNLMALRELEILTE